ncbi:lactate/malate dehydrogenase, NAD binding domain [Tindallia magadiensis]|uniref:Lactate/malate dehydrogenase, NAD binding domain n=1 Tax=Tindallia magadiensis TaxID=69895 RepID=A0A1I3G0T9_9FIRM|nr:hypothetical protein [Tindallia magadiensis]SFI17108.1 lactate/malate dehydrogenase, NAD binding domain [Tindallia magadiensis]
MLYFYEENNCILISTQKISSLKSCNNDQAMNSEMPLYWLVERDPIRSYVSMGVTEPWQLTAKKESLDFIQKYPPKDHDHQLQISDINVNYPWIYDRINRRQLYTLNRNHPRWKEQINKKAIPGKRVHIAGLGDVGGTLLTGLRMHGINHISSIGIYDLSSSKMQRWEQEANQIADLNYLQHPTVEIIPENELFQCDIFIFCIAKNIPEIDSGITDVRMAQLDANADIIRTYAKKARSAGFKGLFAVVSDPVDQLCKIAYMSSNYNEKGEFDFNGLLPDQVKGFGLGVMNARANYYAAKHPETKHYHTEGRAFGPHGKGLFIMDSIINYDKDLSLTLTQQTLTANLSVRKAGYKPYIAPALSSGCYSLIAAINGSWHYSTVFLGGVYFGCRNYVSSYGNFWESYSLPDDVFTELQNTWRKLDEI